MYPGQQQQQQYQQQQQQQYQQQQQQQYQPQQQQMNRSPGAPQYAPPAAPPSLAPLPPFYVQQFDSNQQRYFYVDTRTQISTWNDPRQQYAPPPIVYKPPPDQWATEALPKPQHTAYSQPIPQNLPPTGGNTTFHTAPQVSLYGTESSQSSAIPNAKPVEIVDASVAIGLELKQSIPTLRDAPTGKANSQPARDAYRTYLRNIQDAQNRHTREIRDAQVDHQRESKDAELNSKRYMSNQMGNLANSSLFSSVGNLFNQASNFNSQRQNYNQMLRQAQVSYDKRLERSHEQLNDAVEYANRSYDDVVYLLDKSR